MFMDSAVGSEINSQVVFLPQPGFLLHSGNAALIREAVLSRKVIGYLTHVCGAGICDLLVIHFNMKSRHFTEVNQWV